MRLGILLFLISSLVFAQRVTLSIDSPQSVMGEQIRAQVKIEGRMGSSMPKIAGVGDFQVQNGGSSSQMQIINGSISRSKIITFYLFPKKTGSFVIGPAQVEIGGQIVESNRAKLTVIKGSSVKKSQKFYFLEAVVNNKNPYVGEQITYSYRFYRREISVGGLQPSIPDFSSDFWKEDLGKQREYEKIVDGVRWSVVEVSYALFPSNAGKIIISGSALKAQVVFPSRRRNKSIFGSFLGLGGETKVVSLRAPEIDLNVKALPQGKPANFSGLVGDFRLSTMLTKYKLAVGDSTTFTMKVVGEGNIRGLTMPKVDAKGFKIYEDKPQTTVEADKNVVIGLKEWNLALVPQVEGNYDLGAIQISYFNPKSGTYELTGPKSLKFEVLPGSEEKKVISSPLNGSSKQNVAVIGQDLRPLKRDVFSFHSDVSDLADRIFAIIAVLLMPIVYFIVSGSLKRSLRFKSDKNLIRKEKAYKKFTATVAKLVDNDEMYELSSKALREYLGDKTGLDGLALTPVEANKLLKENRISPDLVTNCTDYLKTCDMGVYGGFRTSFSEMIGNLKDLGKKLEKEIVK